MCRVNPGNLINNINNKHYVDALENVIRQMLNPLKNIPFNLVIESMTWHAVIWYDDKDPRHKETLELLKKVAESACKAINEVWIRSSRPNEVWNKMEFFIKDAFHKMGVIADIPVNTIWKKTTSWYPDIEFRDRRGVYHYLECKTYSADTIFSSQRTFYLSPSASPKIIRDSIHFLISLEIYNSGGGVYKTHGWKILCLKKLLVDVKYEFNANNVGLYGWDLIIAEWSVD